MRDRIVELLRTQTGMRLGVNKLNELARLVFEIQRREGISPEALFCEPPLRALIANRELGFLDKFSGMKQYLIERRYPNAHKEQDFEACFTRLEPASITGKAAEYPPVFVPEAVYIEEAVRASALAARVRAVFPQAPCTVIPSVKEYRQQQGAAGLRKRDLIITRQQWDFIKRCPCTKEVVCCNYHVINLGFGCPYDCSYCYLQHYTNSPGIYLDANIDDFLEKIRPYADRPLRIGTGEFTDSLALDHLTEYSKTLVPFFAGRSATLELKTKSTAIENLLSLDHKGKTVISWSVNPQRIVSEEEHGTPSLKERLQAARRCSEAGYGIGFHFDPVIFFEEWEDEYRQVVDLLFDTVAAPAWISIGTLRFHRSLKKSIEERFPDTAIYGELIIGQDKKMRYSSVLRREIYTKMLGWIRKRNTATHAYLCMEPAEMWRQAKLNTMWGE